MTCKTYNIRVKGEWANIFIDNESGSFSAVSSLGNYAHVWMSIGNKTLEEFLSGVSRDYFMGKTTNHNHMEFYFELAIETLWKELSDIERNKAIAKDRVRQAGDAIADIKRCTTREGFRVQFNASEVLTTLWDHTDSISCVRIKQDVIDFWEIIWPEFLKQIARVRSKSLFAVFFPNGEINRQSIHNTDRHAIETFSNMVNWENEYVPLGYSVRPITITWKDT